MKNIKWFEFNQNNSGGQFITDDKVCHRVFIEAESAQEANFKAEELGIYFNGCENGNDCECCGDRWSRAEDEYDRLKFPYQYSCFDLEEATKLANKYNCDIYTVEVDNKIPYTRNMGDRNKGILFKTIESYAQYLADSYGWHDLDGRIYYNDGRVLEVYRNKKK